MTTNGMNGVSRHLITTHVGKWLADFRDPLPLERPNWILQSRSATWQSDIVEIDFINSIKIEDNGEIWINVEVVGRKKNMSKLRQFLSLAL